MGCPGTYNLHSSKTKRNAITILELEPINFVRHKCSSVIIVKDQTQGLSMDFLFKAQIYILPSGQSVCSLSIVCNFSRSFVFSFPTTMYTWFSKITKVFLACNVTRLWKKFVLQDKQDSLLKRKRTMCKCHESKLIPTIISFYFSFLLQLNFFFNSFEYTSLWFSFIYLFRFWGVPIQVSFWLQVSSFFTLLGMLQYTQLYSFIHYHNSLFPSWHTQTQTHTHTHTHKHTYTHTHTHTLVESF